MNKKIWLWNHYATDMYRNKGGRHYWFAEKLVKRGYDTTIFCANTYHNKTDYIDTGSEKYTTDTINGISFVFVKTSIALNNGIDRVKNMFLFYWNLFSVVKKYIKEKGKPDLILASSVHPLTMVAGIQIARKLKIPCICEIRDLWPEAIFYFNKARENSLLGKVLVKGEHWIYKNASALIFTKEGDKDYIIEKGWSKEDGGDIDLEKVYYINNGLDIEMFNKSANDIRIKDADLDSERFNVTYVGSIRPVNNVGNILDTAKLLLDHEDIQFLIYGEGNQKEFLENRVLEENLFNVKIKGFVDKKYIPYILSKSSVNILNYSQSRYNWSRGNSSNKLFEYMVSGKPVISTIKMGYSIIEKYDCGLELQDGTPEDLKDAILRIKSMPLEEYKKLGENAKKGSEDFDFNVLTEKLIGIIESVENIKL